jgi:hypothetical protein
MLTLDRRFVLALPLLTLAACGPKAVQLYDGPKLDESEVTYMITNPHLKMVVDRQNTIEDQSLQKLELPKGHHVAEVRCIYTPDMTYHPAKGVDPNASGPLKGDFKESPPIAVVMEGEPGHMYKPRAHYERHAGDLPGCRVRMFDVTNESGGHKVDFY